MDKIDSFIIHGKQKEGPIEFTFIITEEDIDENFRVNIIDYIDNFTRRLNRDIPQFKFTWEEAHKIYPWAIAGEIVHQILVQK